MRESDRRTEQNKRYMGLWLFLLGGLFIIAMVAGRGLVNRTVLAYGFILSFFFVFLNKRITNRLEQGEFDKWGQRIVDFSIPFLFLLMFFLVSPFFNMLGVRIGWVIGLSLMGVHYLILSRVFGKSMLLLGGLTLVDGVLLLLVTGQPAFFLCAYIVLLIGFGAFLFAGKGKALKAKEE